MSGDMDGISYATDSDGNLKLFNVEHNDDGQWLNSYYDNPDNVWNADNRFVFARNDLPFFFAYGRGSFCFWSCPFQPPSIRPISSR